MAVELGTGYVSVIPSTRGFAATLNRQVGGDFDRVGRDGGSRLGAGMLGGLGARLAGVGAVIGGAFAAAGLVRVGGAAIGVAADFQQTTIAFEGILGSAEAAQDALGDLRDFAARTPFEFPGLAESAQRLLGVGFAAEELIPIMGTIGDVTAALGQGPDAINGIVRALGQIRGRGRVAAEELNQISDAIPGFSAIGAIAEGMGVTTAEAFALVTQGAVSADEGIGHILAGMERFPGAAGAMERQSQTLNGVISTFKDTLSTAAIDFITPYLPALSSGVQRVGQLITEQVVPWIKDVLVPAIESAVAWVRDNWPQIQEVVSNVLGQVQTVIGDFVTLVQTAWNTWGDNILAVVQRVWPAVQQYIQGAVDIVRGIIQTVTALIAGDWSQVWEGIKTLLSGIWDAIVGIVTIQIHATLAVIGGVLEGLAGLWSGAWNGLVSFLSGIWSTLTSAVSTGLAAVIRFFSDLPGDIVAAVGDVAGAMVQIGRDIVCGIVDGIGRIGGQIRDKILSFVPSLDGILDAVGLGGSGFSREELGRAGIGANATGGFLNPFQASWAGEAGRELVVPLVPSMVVPNHKLMASAPPPGASGPFMFVENQHLHGEVDVDMLAQRMSFLAGAFR